MAEYRFRRFWIAAHRYVGLSAGLVLVVLGLSGSVAVFWNEATQILQSQYRVADPGSEYAPLQTVMETLHAAHPNRLEGWSVDYPFKEDRHSPVWAVYESPEERADFFESPLYVAIDPYTGRTLGEFYWGSTLVSWIFNVHSILAIQSSDIGEKIVGVLGFLFLLLSLSGLYIWWPIGRFHLQQFWVTPGVRGRRLEFHLHKLFGFYWSLVLLCLSITGICIVWPRESAALLGSVQPLSAPIVEETTVPVVPLIPGTSRLPFDATLEKARQLFPGAELRSAAMPSPKGNQVYGVILHQSAERFDRMYPETRVWVHPYTGELMKVVDASKFNTSRAIVGNNRYTFHNGSAFGLTGRVLVFIAGFLPLFFFYTGVRQWLATRFRKRLSSAGQSPGSP